MGTDNEAENEASEREADKTANLECVESRSMMTPSPAPCSRLDRKAMSAVMIAPAMTSTTTVTAATSCWSTAVCNGSGTKDGEATRG